MDGITEKTAIEGSKIEFRKISAHFGASVTGIDVGKPLSAADHQALSEGLAKYEVLVFRDQDITAQNLMDFGSSFSELTVHPFSPNDDNNPELIVFDNKEGNPPFSTDVWHSDETFRLEPPMATMLCAKIVPEVGGDTMFSSMSAGYESLSQKIKDLIEDMVGVHDLGPFKRLFGGTKEGRALLLDYGNRYPLVAHPIVRIHPESGKRVLFVNPQFTVHIEGLTQRESDHLLDILFHQAVIPEYQYRHHWEPNTLVLWDNRSVQHYAVHDYYPQRRKMDRVTLKGTVPVGPAGPSVFLEDYLAQHDDSEDGVDKFGGHRPLRQFDRENPEI